MKLSDFSELHLVAVVAFATFLGGIGSSLLGVFLVDAGTNRQTDVQLVEVAIGILSSTEPRQSNSPDTVLRAWAVDTINSAAEVKLDGEARQLLISGEVFLSATKKSLSFPEGRLTDQVLQNFFNSFTDAVKAHSLEQSEDGAELP